ARGSTADVICVEPSITAVHSDLIRWIEIVIDLEVDLLAIGIGNGSIRQPEFATAMSTAHPLGNRSVQSVSSVKHICMRHYCEVLLSDASRILLRAVGVKRRGRNLGIRTIRLNRCIGDRAEDTEESQL